jgi:aminotransferase
MMFRVLQGKYPVQPTSHQKELYFLTKSMKAYINPLVEEIPSSGIRKFFDLASASTDIISLGVGEPDFITPVKIREASTLALLRGTTHYSNSDGLQELREEIALYLSLQFNLSYRPEDEVLVTVGGSEAIDLALRALVSPGDEILIPVPTYICYSPVSTIVGGKPVPIETSAKDQFKLTPEALEARITERSKILILCYPSNPTGAIMTREDWLPIANLIKKHDLLVLSDEIYAELTYGSKHVSIASMPGMKERTIVLSGFSKAFAMTGWRIGYACGHPVFIEAMKNIHYYTIKCSPVFGQIAALEALRSGMEDKDEMVAAYNKRRNRVITGFREIGLSCHEPQGAFYAFPSIRSTGLSSEEFAERLLFEGKVAAIPGNAFGLGGEGFIRCSYATSEANLEEAIDRIASFLNQLKQI